MRRTSRELVHAALEFQTVERIPLEAGKHPDVAGPPYQYGAGRSDFTNHYKKGLWRDYWGCCFEAAEDGVIGEVKEYLLSDWSALKKLVPPWDVLDNADLSQVNRACAESDKFQIKMWGTDPFQRMQYLRGTQQLFMDLAYGDREVYQLRDIVHEYYLKEVEMWAKTDVDAIHLEDDWGTQKSLLISPQMWREYFKPLYRDYCEIAHSHHKKVVMHSDGYIMDIIGELAEIGVDAINAQLDCMDLQELADRYVEKIAFWGGLGRQYFLPFGTVEEVKQEVCRIAQILLKDKRSGVIGGCNVDKDARPENVDAVYEQWARI